jgi:hypothetical protein
MLLRFGGAAPFSFWPIFIRMKRHTPNNDTRPVRKARNSQAARHSE